MYIPVATLMALVMFGAFLWWATSSENAAQRKREERDREFERQARDRELRTAKERIERLEKDRS